MTRSDFIDMARTIILNTGACTFEYAQDLAKSQADLREHKLGPFDPDVSYKLQEALHHVGGVGPRSPFAVSFEGAPEWAEAHVYRSDGVGYWLEHDCWMPMDGTWRGSGKSQQSDFMANDVQRKNWKDSKYSKMDPMSINEKLHGNTEKKLAHLKGEDPVADDIVQAIDETKRTK